MSEKEYRVIKGFSLKDLYNNNCPIEIFEDVFSTYSCGNIELDYPIYNCGDSIVHFSPKTMQQGHSWWIENGYIEEVIPDIELKPGMILEDSYASLVMTTDGLYLFGGWQSDSAGTPFMFQNVKTLQQLNRLSGGAYRIKK